MPISSSEIAALNAGFAQAAYGQQQYASSIGAGAMYAGMQSGVGSDAMMGGMMNRASSVGAPLAMGAMGLLGLDPMSLGLKAGIGAFGAGAGFGGAALAGAGVAMPLMAAGAGLKYAGQQMYTGAHQQMALNNTLRSSFNFQNQQTGGAGFSRNDMTQIGEAMRGMTEQFGPGGEITGFRELTNIAGKMGTMGFAQGVRDVQEFSKRFKDMVHTLKGMATELGTTLEGAMEMAASAKQSGIFGGKNLTAMTSAMRGAAVSGELAMSEVTGAASIGSQIARSVGGLGRQGAMAGIRTMSQIGTAERMGVLSEEDIYNATGLTGAEGRQAFAASSMSRTASWLKGGRGRRLLASMAGKDGTLDESAVQELLTGGMSISETMRNDQSHLKTVGRANFIRNEGRLRGAAMERLGGFVPALQLKEWAASRGIDVNEMDDRSMLFAQRQLGMGRDELEATMKIVNNLPQLIEQERRSGRQDQYFQANAQARKGQGIEGVKQRMDQAKELINGKLQHVGQEIFNQGSEQIDTFFNKLFGTYVQSYSKDIDDLYHTSMQGGAMGRSAASRGFGVGGMSLNRAATDAFRRAGPLGGGSTGLDLATSLSQGSQGDLASIIGSNKFDNYSELGKYLLHGQSGAGRLKEAGFDISGMNSKQILAKLGSIQDVQRAAALGASAGGAPLGSEATSAWLRDAYMMNTVSGEGDERIASFGAALKRQARSDPAAAALLSKWQNGSQADKAALQAQLEAQAGISGKGALAARYGLPEGGMASLLARGGVDHGYASLHEENSAFAAALGAHKETVEEWNNRALGGGLLSKAANALNGAANFLSFGAGKFGEGLGSRLTGSDAREQAIGAFAKGEEFRNLSMGLLSSDKETAAAAQTALEKDVVNAGKEGNNDPIVQIKKQMLTAAKFASFMSSGTTPPSDEAQEAFAKANGMSLQQLRSTLGGMAQIVDARQRADMSEEARRIRDRATKDKSQLSGLGIMDKNGNLSAATAGELGKLGKGALEYAQLSVGIVNSEASMQGTDSGVEGDRAIYQKNLLNADQRESYLAGLSLKDKRAVASALQGSEAGAEAGRAAGMQTTFNGLARRKGMAGATAQLLGVEGYSKAQLAKMDLTGAGADQLLAAAGITDKNAIADLRAGAKAGAGGLSEAIRKIVESPEFQNKQKEKREKDQEDKDPLQAAIKDNTGKMVTALDKMTASLSTIATNTATKTPADGPPKPGTPPPAAKG